MSNQSQNEYQNATKPFCYPDDNEGITTDNKSSRPQSPISSLVNTSSPYHFTVDGTTVRLRFNESRSLNARLANAFNAMLG